MDLVLAKVPPQRQCEEMIGIVERHTLASRLHGTLGGG